MSARMTLDAFRTLAALGLCAGLAACASKPAPDAVADPRTPTEQFVAKVSGQPEEIRLAVHAQGLSPNQSAALAAFADHWRDSEGGPIRIQAPSVSGPDGAGAYRTAEGARTALIAQGVPDRQIEVVGYDAAGVASAPVVVGYLLQQVTLPRCGQVWQNFASTSENRVQSNFGCAVSANMAAQIANPADLVAPRDMDPADAGRRQVVTQKYRAGEITSAATDDKADGAVSQAVK